MTTFADLQAEVVGRQFAESQYSDFALKQLRRAEAILAAEVDFRAFQRVHSVTTENGYPSYFLPANFARAFTVVQVESDFKRNPMRVVQQPEFDALAIESGKPSRYNIYGNTLRLWPTPDGPYQISLNYYAKPLPDAESPEIPEEYHHILVDWALSRCYKRENDYNSSQASLNDFEREKEKMKGQVQYDTSDYSQPRIIGDDAPFGVQDEAPRRP